MSKIPTPQEVITKYLEDRERIKRIKRDAADAVAAVEKFQRAREDFLLAREDMEVFGFMTDLFVNGRDGKAEKEKEKQDIGLRQTEIEKWLLKMLSKVGEGIRTEFGTVYKTRKESVSVGDWDAFMETEILRPAGERICELFGIDVKYLDNVLEAIRSTAHLEYLNHAVNKTACLEHMGEMEKKNGEEGGRPNPPPTGVNYTAVQTVGVRKGK